MAKSKLKIAINGFGRTGRAATRIALRRPNDIDVVAINSKADAANYAYLLKYDSLYGTLNDGINVVDENTISFNGHKIKVFSLDEGLPWKNLGIDIVIESSGKFTKKEKAIVHINDGAQRVIIGAPSSDADATFVYGVNEKTFDPKKHFVVSNASCTTNCLAPLAMLIDREFEIVMGYMNTIHAYTNDQRLHDNSHKKDLRRARAATYSIIPTSTGAAKAIGLVLPQLQGKLDGISLRVPVPTVSMLDLSVVTKKKTTKEELNTLFKKEEKGKLKGILSTSDLPLVSVDFKGNTHSSIVDTQLTTVMNGNLLKVFAWYDNEWGYASRMIDLALYIHQNS